MLLNKLTRSLMVRLLEPPKFLPQSIIRSVANLSPPGLLLHFLYYFNYALTYTLVTQTAPNYYHNNSGKRETRGPDATGTEATKQKTEV